MAIKDIEKSFGKYYGSMFESGDFDALIVDIRTAIRQAFEATRMKKEKLDTEHEFSNEEWETFGYNQAIAEQQKRQEEFLKE